jgi:hypothetical protein
MTLGMDLESDDVLLLCSQRCTVGVSVYFVRSREGRGWGIRCKLP